MSIQVKVSRPPGDKEASSISDDLIVTESMAVSRGKRFLDDPTQGNYYNTVQRTFKSIHKGSHIYPSKWVEISDSNLGLTNKRVKVLSYTIEISKNGIWATLGTEEYYKNVE